MPNRFTMYVLIAMLLGLLTGWGCNVYLDAAQNAELAGHFKIATDVFLRLIKMIIAPLVVSTLIVGIAHMGDTKALGRAGAKTMAWFISASIVSLALGALIVTLLKPGVGLNLPLPAATDVVEIKSAGLGLAEFVTYMVPMSIFDAMSKNQILPIVLFSVFFGVACASLGKKAEAVVTFFEQLSYVMLKVTGLKVAYGGIQAVKGVSFEVNQGAPAFFSWCAVFANLLRLPFRPPALKLPIRALWISWRNLAYRAGLPASCCRWAILLIWTAR